MLAAGKGTRFAQEHRGIPKSLLKIHENHSIFDFILDSLEIMEIPQLYLISGYKSELFFQHIQNKPPRKFPIITLLANPDFDQGPIYTLLSIPPKIREKFEKFVIIPSDTLFHPEILNQIFTSSVVPLSDCCQIFVMNISKEHKIQYNQVIPFSPNSITQSSKFFPLISNIAEKSNESIFIPIVILTRSFIEYVNAPENQISGKLIENLHCYHQKFGKCSITRVEYDNLLPPFIDIDTSQIYSALNSAKVEIYKSYKYK